jgi:hypothetical protein
MSANAGPPLLPELIAESTCSDASRPAWLYRAMQTRLTMPLVTHKESPPVG